MEKNIRLCGNCGNETNTFDKVCICDSTSFVTTEDLFNPLKGLNFLVEQKFVHSKLSLENLTYDLLSRTPYEDYLKVKQGRSGSYA